MLLTMIGLPWCPLILRKSLCFFAEFCFIEDPSPRAFSMTLYFTGSLLFILFLYRHSSFYCTLLYCSSQMLHFLQIKGTTLHPQKDYDLFYCCGLEPNPQSFWGMRMCGFIPVITQTCPGIVHLKRKKSTLTAHTFPGAHPTFSALLHTEPLKISSIHCLHLIPQLYTIWPLSPYCNHTALGKFTKTLQIANTLGSLVSSSFLTISAAFNPLGHFFPERPSSLSLWHNCLYSTFLVAPWFFRWPLY